MSLLTKKEVYGQLNNWEFINNSIIKTFEFPDFADAIGFIVRLGFEAEKADHHPDIFLHSWNKVKITLSTHSEGGVTGKDIELAKNIEKLI